MTRRVISAFVALTLSASLTASSLAQSVVLKMKFAEGRTDYYEEIESDEQVIKGGPVGEQGMTVSSRRIRGLDRKVESAEKDKTVVAFRFGRMATVFEMPGNSKMSYDSDLAAQEPGGEMFAEILETIVGETVRVEIGADGRTANAAGMDKIVAKIDDKVGGNPFWSQMKPMLNDESFAIQMINNRAALLPEKEVKAGDTWSVKTREPMPSVGEIARDLRCGLKSVAKKGGRTIATLEFEGTVSNEKAAASQPGMQVKLEGGKTRGTFEFDVEGGDFVSGEDQSELKLVASMGGGEDNAMKVALKSRNQFHVLTPKERAEQKRANAEQKRDEPTSKPASAPSEDK
ncbi:MAG: hypothetical protein HZB38_06910 [Planctomycetes bacterium]|nr:hypothetical protein [Planctomycetota bacterium]